jgi:predicted alpha/beta hydrolase family esterase
MTKTLADDQKTNQPTYKVYIIHGYGASPQHHWFPWLKQQLEQQGIVVQVPPLPDPEHPVKPAWDKCLAQAIEQPDQYTFFVAHSLGCIALLDYLQQLDPQPKIGGLLLVSGFHQPVPGYSLINPFVAHALQPEQLIALTPQRVVIAAQDDPVVPHDLSQHLSEKLQARIISLPQGGHLLGSDGFTQFQQVYEILGNMLSSNDREL